VKIIVNWPQIGLELVDGNRVFSATLWQHLLPAIYGDYCLWV